MKCKYCKYCFENICIGCGENRLIDPDDEGCINYETEQRTEENTVRNVK